MGSVWWLRWVALVAMGGIGCGVGCGFCLPMVRWEVLAFRGSPLFGGSHEIPAADFLPPLVVAELCCRLELLAFRISMLSGGSCVFFLPSLEVAELFCLHVVRLEVR